MSLARWAHLGQEGKSRTPRCFGFGASKCRSGHAVQRSGCGLTRKLKPASLRALRIDGLADNVARESRHRDRQLVRELADVLKSDPEHVLDRARALREERSELEKRVDQLAQKLAAQESGKIADEAEDIEGVKVIAKRIDAQNRDDLLKYADSLRDKLGEGVALLAAEIEGKPALVCMVTDDAFKNRKLKAGDLINQAASHVGGRGGGRPTLAQAGGSDLAGISAAVENFGRIVREAL